MSSDYQAITIGTASASTSHAGDLGKRITSNGKVYVLLKAAAAITAAAQKAVQWTYTAGVPNFIADLPAAAASGDSFAIVPVGQTGSTGTTGLVAGDYFYAQVSGPFVGLSGSSLTASEATAVGLNVSSTGTILSYAKITSVTVTLLQNMRNTCFITTTADTSAGDTIKGILSGLI